MGSISFPERVLVWQVALGFNVTGRLTVEINSEDPYQLGFETWQGRLAPYLISFQGYGEAVPPNAPPLPGQAYLDHCPPGMWVSGYQVNTGNVLTRIRIRCSCLKCGERLSNYCNYLYIILLSHVNMAACAGLVS